MKVRNQSPQKDLNEPYRTMEEVALQHLQLNQPERYAKLEKEKQLKAWAAPRVERAKEEYGRLVESGTPPHLADEQAVRHNLLVGYEPEDLEQYSRPEENASPV